MVGTRGIYHSYDQNPAQHMHEEKTGPANEDIKGGFAPFEIAAPIFWPRPELGQGLWAVFPVVERGLENRLKISFPLPGCLGCSGSA